ncbi:MAG: hypothetical protein CSA11_04065 [Chloroflexi bacterium]|nr:MAG: hypothetical protein CSB13_01300 [Chloroflexota bacterium]PIE81523.1 MAG: hypothetical protein CSA11_04065 [Chloroflexota bacterium]
MINQLIPAFFLSSSVASLAFWRGSLSKSGVAGALLVGTLIFGLGGWFWGLLLTIFFISSSLLSHFKETEKREAAEKFEKGHCRDFGQAMANGGVGALVALLNVLLPSPAWFFMFTGAMATVTADTWATELGTLSESPPRLITTGEVVEVGTSGGISPLGTAVSMFAGLLIGLAAGLFGKKSVWQAGMIGALSGLVGSLFDSLLGATVQQIFYCDTCQKDTERKIHKCGTATRQIRGYSWLNNDMVNLLASLVGGIVAVVFWFLLRGKKQ